MDRFVLHIAYWVASLLPIVFLAAVSWFSWHGYIAFTVISAIFAFLFWWMRYIEPWHIGIHHVHVPLGLQKKIVLISDLHIGMFKGARFLEKVVAHIQQITGVDFVVIAGDLTYEPKPQSLSHLFRSLKDIVPNVYAVLGNHDVGFPGPAIVDELRSVLREHNVNLLENHVIDFKEFYLAGLGDWDAQQDDVAVLDACDPTKPKIVIAHNPDTTLKYGNREIALTLSGHTHGAQVRIPGLVNRVYRRFLNLVGKFDEGLHEERFGTLYISAGLGEVGMPWRLGSRPRIDVIYV